jgi:hypothetical protein
MGNIVAPGVMLAALISIAGGGDRGEAGAVVAEVTPGATVPAGSFVPLMPPDRVPDRFPVAVEPDAPIPSSIEAAKHEPAPAPARVPAVPVPACAVVVSEAAMIALVSGYEWDGYPAAEIARLFLLESSGGCVDVISVTNDWGCTQIHRAYGRDAWIDFDRLLVDCAYGVAVAREVWAKREAAGLCGVCGWYAGRGWLWR